VEVYNFHERERRMERKRLANYIILVLTALMLLGTGYIVQAKPNPLYYTEIPISGVLGPQDYKLYECGTPHTIRVVITDSSYCVAVDIRQSGGSLWNGILGPGESSPWKNANDQETWIIVEHPGGTMLAVTYIGEIQMYID
jgi:hypothetical protein